MGNLAPGSGDGATGAPPGSATAASAARLAVNPGTRHDRRPRVFGMVAGEASGDLLGEGLILALKRTHPTARFVGIGGPKMIAAGLEAWYRADELAVMGLSEVLRHLPRLLRIRSDLTRRMRAADPDVFVGIDAPDFNLPVEKKLKRLGLLTVHYVSPSVWAWRPGRAAKIGASADLVLCLFPMEPEIYARYGVRAEFVGHPLADQFPLVNDRNQAREQLRLCNDAPVLAVLPGSRLGEIQRLGADFLEAARRCKATLPSLQIVAPMASGACRQAFEQLAATAGISIGPMPAEAGQALHVQLLDGHAHEAMHAADVVLLASGTAALEAMLAKRPMVVAYRVAAWTYRIVTWFRLMRTSRYSLPNVLSGRDLVPEILQDDCTPGNLAAALLTLLSNSALRIEMVGEFEQQHRRLQANANSAAAAAIDSLLQQSSSARQS